MKEIKLEEKEIWKIEEEKNIKAEVATKASLTIGCHPIKVKDVEDLRRLHGDSEKARREAVMIYLRDYLQFNDDKLKEVEVKDTETSAKGDNTIYVAFGSIDTIKELHRRAAEIRNPDIMLRNYVPPQFSTKYMHLSKACTEYRQKNPDMKTQIRFGSKDIEILLKKRDQKKDTKQYLMRKSRNLDLSLNLNIT